MKLENYKPQRKFSQTDMLCLQDYTTDEIYQVLSLALELKKMRKKGIKHEYLQDKTLAMIFTKSSTRTRVSFEAGMQQLGGHAMFLSGNDIQLGRGEPISDTAQVMSRMVDCIMIRTFAHSDIEELARYSDVPVINALSDLLHPCQVLADLQTIYEHKGTLEGLKLAYIGDGNNMAHSLMIGCTKVGMNVSIGCPEAYRPDEKISAMAYSNAKANGCNLIITSDPKKAIKDADIVYCDVWASMGQEAEQKIREKAFAGFCVDKDMFALAKKDACFMHCLPAHRGEEVTSDVIDSKSSIIFDQAENRLHAQKALMVLLVKGWPL